MNKVKAWIKAHKVWTAVIVLLVLFIGIGASGDTPTKETAKNNEAQTTVNETKTDNKKDETPKQQEIPTPNYSVVSSTKDERFDKKNTYYVTIEAVDLANDNFKQSVKLVVKALAKQNGSTDFTANIYDDEATAKAGANYYSNPSTDQAEIKAKSDQRGQHLVASYSGGIDEITAKVSTADSAYVLNWYPGAFKDTPNVGKYVGNEQFKP